MRRSHRRKVRTSESTWGDGGCTQGKWKRDEFNESWEYQTQRCFFQAYLFGNVDRWSPIRSSSILEKDATLGTARGDDT